MASYVKLNEQQIAEIDSTMRVQHLQTLIVMLCETKVNEFALLGYHGIEAADVWSCMQARYKAGPYPALHQLVEDMLSIKINDFMTWRTLSIYK